MRKKLKGFWPLEMSGGLLFWVVITVVLIFLFLGLTSSTPSGISGTKDNLLDSIIGWFT